MERLLFICTFLLLISTNSLAQARENLEKFKSTQMERSYEAKMDKVLIEGANGYLLTSTDRFYSDSFSEVVSKHSATDKIAIQHNNDRGVALEINSNFDLHNRHENWNFETFQTNNFQRWEHALVADSWTGKYEPRHWGWEDQKRLYFCTDPVPEPSNYLMLLVGIVVISFMQRAKVSDK